MSLNRRPVRIRLRNGRRLSAQVHITEGQSLSTFLSTKLHFLNLTDVRWTDGGADEAMDHLGVRIDQIVWVEPVDPGLHLSSAALPSDETRNVELQVSGATGWDRLHVQMNVSRETRMSDYLDANPGFIPLWSVQVVETGETVERAALRHGAILVIRELGKTDPRQRG